MSRLTDLRNLENRNVNVGDLLKDEEFFIKLSEPNFHNIAVETRQLLQLATVKELRPLVARAIKCIFQPIQAPQHHNLSDQERNALQAALPTLGELFLSLDTELRKAAIVAIHAIATNDKRRAVLAALPYESMANAVRNSKVTGSDVSLINEICLIALHHQVALSQAKGIVEGSLRHSDPQYRLSAARQCAQVAQSPNLEFLPFWLAKILIRTSADALPEIRIESIRAFTNWKRYQLLFVPQATKMLEDENVQVRITAFGTLQGMVFAIRAKRAIQAALRHHPELANL